MAAGNTVTSVRGRYILAGLWRRLSVKARLGLVVGALALLGTSLQIQALLTDAADLRQAASAKNTSRAQAALAAGTVQLAMLHAVTELSLADPKPVTAERRALIDSLRERAGAALESALVLPPLLRSGGDIAYFTEEIGRLRASMKSRRASLDAALALPRSERDMPAQTAMMAGLTADNAAIQATRALLLGAGELIPSEITRLGQIRDAAWAMREFAGRDQTGLAVAVTTASPIPPPLRARLDAMLERAQDAYLDMRNLIRPDGTDPDVRKAVDRLAEKFAKPYLGLRQRILAQADAATPAYGIDPDQYVSQSQAALGAIDKIVGHCSEAISRQWQLRADAAQRRMQADAGLAALFIAVAAVALTTLFNALRRLDQLRASMRILADDRDVASIPGLTDTDEIGEMARTVAVFRDNRLARLRLEARAREEAEQRDRRQAAMDAHTVDFGRAMAGTMHALTESARTMQLSANALRLTAEAGGENAISTAESAFGTSNDLTTVASAVAEMSNTAAQIAREVAATAGITRDAVRRTQTTDTAMQGLTGAAAQIGTIASAIRDIAGRTNLLALNATIEAARAGEAGRGFAVVAAEVKQLAAQTAGATQEIARQINEIQSATATAVDAMQSVTDSIRQINHVANTIAVAAEQQGATIDAISTNINQAAEATSLAFRNMEGLCETAGETRILSATVAESSQGLTAQSAVLRGEVEYFLVAMRDCSGDRRQFERHELSGQTATVLHGDQQLQCRLRDISLGGFSLDIAIDAPVGSEIAVKLPGSTEPVTARLVHSTNGQCGLFFRQDEITRRLVSAVMTHLVPVLREAA